MTIKIHAAIKSILTIVILVWLLMSLIVFFNQKNLIYVPLKKYTNTPKSYGLDFESIKLSTKDNETINSWFIPHKNSRATLLFLHGNGGNLSTRLDSIKIFHQLGLSVFIIDYRGYGESSGSPSEEGTYIDAETALIFLKDIKNLAEDEIIIYGRSLGGAVAIWLANKYKSLGLIVESSFTSIIDMGKYKYPYLPIKYLANIHYPSIEIISNVNTPSLFIHSKHDEIVPYEFGKNLFNSANEPKDFLDINGLHNDGFLTSGRIYTIGIEKFLKNKLKK